MSDVIAYLVSACILVLLKSILIDSLTDNTKPAHTMQQLVGYRGKARVMVSLVSDSDPPVPHAHSIVGKNTMDGRCIVEMGPESEMYAQ